MEEDLRFFMVALPIYSDFSFGFVHGFGEKRMIFGGKYDIIQWMIGAFGAIFRIFVLSNAILEHNPQKHAVPVMEIV